ncbi:DNA-3-methyladenine glycosylase [Kribbella solani]|uniref:Putative 3-methyladenine DNA glycosylase n=1 Tax=Kribbella solani TaxID=236067 RepID=A0A841E4Q5_9ACTN|nr:DNA-3-methyladenine glycosylase [Kribbella solani]MBB5983965.1 DNA-3-methyladenine glycosylase [Kribbella solani]
MRRSLLAGPVLDVAPKLLGMVLRSTTQEGTVAVRLTEVEAYDGANDPGSHAYRGPTARTEVMFGPPGFLYVYFTYGMHFCMNVVAGPDGKPSAVLLRAGEVIEGLDLARTRRGHLTEQRTAFSQTSPGTGKQTPGIRGDVQGIRGGAPGAEGATPAVRKGPVVKRPKPSPDRDLARGPARLCVALGIGRSGNGIDLLAKHSPIQLLPGPGYDGEPSTGPRVGLRDAADRPWRFWIPNDPTVSPYRPHVPKRR